MVATIFHCDSASIEGIQIDDPTIVEVIYFVYWTIVLVRFLGVIILHLRRFFQPSRIGGGLVNNNRIHQSVSVDHIYLSSDVW